MSQRHSPDIPPRNPRYHVKDGHKIVHALSAFDDDDGRGAPSPSISLGSRDNPTFLAEQIAYDPVFRNKDPRKSKDERDRSQTRGRIQTSASKRRETPPRVEQVMVNEEFPEQHRSRPRSSSTLSHSATSVRSQSQSQSHSRILSSASSMHGSSFLPALQAADADLDGLEPLAEEEIDPSSFDLVIPANGLTKRNSLETQSELLFSTKHLSVIFDDPLLLQRFTNYLHTWRPQSIPLLVYYLDALKALKAIQYANSLSVNLGEIEGLDFTIDSAADVMCQDLRDKAKKAFETLTNNDLPAFITQTYIQTVSVTIKRRIANTLPLHLREQSEGLAEVFCLTDPSRPDNPIVFASEEFHRTTQYGMSHVLGRNCRFLQGPKTNPFSVKRLREKIQEGKEHCETFLNYRRDGSPFMNLLMIAPLVDSRGIVRYHIGAQVDVSGLVRSCAGLESLSQLMDQEETNTDHSVQGTKPDDGRAKSPSDSFRELAEMLNLSELKIVRESGGILHRTQQEDIKSGEQVHNWSKPRLLISDDATINRRLSDPTLQTLNIDSSGRLRGVYEHYLLVRPYPSLRVLFASPSLRVPGMLQSPFMDRIGGSSMIRDSIIQAFAEGNGITAKVRWTTRLEREGRGRPRWIHCTPLLGLNGAVGVWMVVLVEDEAQAYERIPRDAPPVARQVGPKKPLDDDEMSLSSFAEAHRDNGDNRPISRQ